MERRRGAEDLKEDPGILRTGSSLRGNRWGLRRRDKKIQEKRVEKLIRYMQPRKDFHGFGTYEREGVRKRKRGFREARGEHDDIKKGNNVRYSPERKENVCGYSGKCRGKLVAKW